MAVFFIAKFSKKKGNIMKYKNIEIINAVHFLNALSDKKLPQKINYAIVRNIRNLQNEYDVYIKSLNNLIENYKDHIVKDENGKVQLLEIGVPSVDDEVKDEYINELNELLNIEVDVPIYKIPENVFNYEGIQYDALSPKESMLLIDLFGEDTKDGD